MMKRYSKANLMATCSMLSGLSLGILYLASIVPRARIGMVAIAGLVPAAAIISYQLRAGVYCYVVTSILGMILVPDKGIMLLYTVLLGLYSIIKYLCERIKNIGLGWAVKLLFFNLVAFVSWVTIGETMMPLLPPIISAGWMMCALGNVAFIIYDVGFTKLIFAYTTKVDKHLRK